VDVSRRAEHDRPQAVLMVTRRHRAMSNLRASGTIIVLRFLPAISVLVRYHGPMHYLSGPRNAKPGASEGPRKLVSSGLCPAEHIIP
jgi:hypothetical protein